MIYERDLGRKIVRKNLPSLIFNIDSYPIFMLYLNKYRHR